MKRILPLVGFTLAALTSGAAENATPAAWHVERLDPALDQLIATDAKIEKLAEGFTWSEGPTWFEGALLFSDVPKNTVYRWKEGMTEAEVFLKPSGQLTPAPGFREPGSNGLTVDRAGKLLLCQDGERRIARWEGDGKFTSLAERYDGKRLNTPNDLAVKSDGTIYFTDPPYGFEKIENDPKQEQPFHGVYRAGKDGTVTLLTKTIKFPNGIAFSPDEKTLYVSSTENRHSRIEAFDVQPDGTVANQRLFFDGQALSKPGLPGACDGFKIDREGNLWTSGPGGILVITPAGKLIGRINIGLASNCAWGDDGSTLYITANHAIARVRTKTKGNGW
jgi:gluconolactonase